LGDLRLAFSDSDDDFFFFSRPPSPPPPPPPLPHCTVILSRLRVSIPIVPQWLRDAHATARRLFPELRADRLSGFLAQAIRADKPIDNLVERIVLAGTDPREFESHIYRREAKTFLSFCFPRISSADLLKNFNCGVRVWAAYHAIESLRDPHFLKVPRRPPPISTFTDVALAMDICDLFDEEASERRQRDIEQARLTHDLIECECCCEGCLAAEIVRCPQGHRFCQRCLRRWTETILAEGRTDVRCLHFGGCDELIRVSVLESFLSEKTLRRLFATETQNAVANANLEGLVRCHKCGFCVEFSGSGDFHCPECKADTCSGCGQPAHQGMSCREFQEVDRDRFVEGKISDAVVRVCPKCHIQFVKEDGCNRMECPRCHTWICYWCKKEVPREVGYAHFWRALSGCPPDKCPLWVSSEDVLHRLEMRNAEEQTKEMLG
jgi:TRIAD3 protein (E3 ubiquitin-protein ligase RNF216)